MVACASSWPDCGEHCMWNGNGGDGEGGSGGGGVVEAVAAVVW